MNRPRELFVSGLPYHLSNEKLSSYFASFGPISKFTRPPDRRTGRNGSFAFLSYRDISIFESVRTRESHSVDGIKFEVRLSMTKEEMKNKRKEDGTMQKAENSPVDPKKRFFKQHPHRPMGGQNDKNRQRRDLNNPRHRNKFFHRGDLEADNTPPGSPGPYQKPHYHQHSHYHHSPNRQKKLDLPNERRTPPTPPRIPGKTLPSVRHRSLLPQKPVPMEVDSKLDDWPDLPETASGPLLFDQSKVEKKVHCQLDEKIEPKQPSDVQMKEEESPEKEPIKEDEVSKPITMQEEEAIPDDQPEPTSQQEPIRSPEPTFDQPMENAEEVPYEAPMGSPELPPKSPEQIPERPIESKEGVTYQEPISYPEQPTDKPMASPERPEKPIRIPQYEEARRSPTYEVPTDRLIEADEESEMTEAIDERIPKNGEPALLIETSETVRSLYRESPSGQDDFEKLESGAIKLEHFVGCELIRCFIRIFNSSKRHELTFTNVSAGQVTAFDRLKTDYPDLTVTELADGQVTVLKKTNSA